MPSKYAGLKSLEKYTHAYRLICRVGYCSVHHSRSREGDSLLEDPNTRSFLSKK